MPASSQGRGTTLSHPWNSHYDPPNAIYEDTYNKDRNYGVKKFEMPTKGGFDTIDKNYNKFHDMLDKLNAREVTGNDAIALVEKTIG